MGESRKAGTNPILWMIENPLGEEILEGTMGGLLTGAGQLGSDQPLGQTALQTAAAIVGGIGLGMLGRRAGAWAGRQLHSQPLKNQHGMLANLARTAGSETTTEGLKQQGAATKALIQESLVNNTASAMAAEAAADPAAFAARYGISAQQFDSMIPRVKAARQGAAALGALEQMGPEARSKLVQDLLADFQQVENAVTQRASGSIDEVLGKVQQALDKGDLDLSELGIGEDHPLMSRLRSGVAGLSGPVRPVTGEHVGRMLGRFLGDEVGIIGGLMGGNLLAQQLGMESPKDAKIRELEKQLANRS